MAKYLVTGGFGFIGSQLVKSLINTGNSVNILEPRLVGDTADISGNIHLVKGSTTDRAAMEKAFDGVEACFHLAGVALDHDPRRDQSNSGDDIGGYAKILFNCAQSSGNIPVIYASSAAVYSPQPSGPISETAPTQPVNAHGEEKLLLEREAAKAFDESSLPSVGLRFFNVYGPTQSLRSIYCGAPRRFVELIRTNQPIPLYGGGYQIRDFTHVDDAVNSMLQVIRHPISKALLVNIGTGLGTTIGNLAQIIGEMTGETPVLEDRPLGKTDVKESIADTNLAERLFKFRTKISLTEGLREMIEKLR